MLFIYLFILSTSKYDHGQIYEHIFVLTQVISGHSDSSSKNVALAIHSLFRVLCAAGVSERVFLVRAAASETSAARSAVGLRDRDGKSFIAATTSIYSAVFLTKTSLVIRRHQWRSKALRGRGSTVIWGPPFPSPPLPLSFPPLPQPSPSPCREAAPKSS